MPSGNILVVDDDSLICCGLKKLFSGRSFDVTTVGNGKDAISEFDHKQYETVFLDVNLPDMNGLQILKEIKSRAPETRVVVMTADEPEDWREQALTGGAAKFIRKPFNLPDIERVMDQLSSPEA